MATFAIDPAHTDVLFSAKHMMVTTVRGTFTDVSGSIDIDESEPTASKAELTVKAASVDTGFGPRDTHLRSGDFFAAETYPEIRVVSTKIRPKGGNDFVVTADVTIKDVTKPVDFDVEFLGFYTGHGRLAAGRFQRQGQGQSQGLGPRLERRPRGRRLAGRRPDQARSRRRTPGVDRPRGLTLTGSEAP